MELAVRPEDSDILLKDRNVLNETVIEKYRLAGQVSQTCLQYLTSLINDSYHLGKRDPISVSELCIMGDSYIASSLQNVYKKGPSAVRERGIAQPVTIELNDIVSGFSPELGDESNCFFKPGDIVTISLGCHIDGYTSNLSHTLVIYPPGGEELKPTGPLLGSKADAICAAHVATEAVVALLGASLTPEKLPAQLNTSNNTVTGSQIRNLVDCIAESYNCIVAPGSRVRRVRRFLAGQSEGIVAERDYKGVAWSESDQELKLLKKSNKLNSSTDLITVDKSKTSNANTSTAIPTDEFIITPGEVYMIDIRMAPTSDINEPGLVTLQTIDNYTGTNNDESSFHSKPSIYVRDYAVQYQLKLRASKQLINKIDKDLSVFPFKLAHTSKSFPISSDSSESSEEQLIKILNDIKQARLGLSELSNRRLCVSRPIQITRFIPLPVILNSANPTGPIGYDSEKPTLPGLEIPLPRLGLTSLKIKSMLKKSKFIPVAKEVTTIALNSDNNEVLRLTGGSKISKPSWVHSAYELTGEYKDSIVQLVNLTEDKRFGIKIREIQPFKFKINDRQTVENMQVD